MKFLIAGMGSIGRRHLRNLLSLGYKDIILYRTHKSTLPDEELSDFPAEKTMEGALSHQPAAVIISNPTFMHMQTAVPAAKAGCALFIEKPIAYQMDELAPFEKVINNKKNKIFSAFQFRFNPGLKKIKDILDTGEIGQPLSFRCHWGEYLPDWHPWEDYRASYSANSEMGGGVVLTLCHPVDYLRWLFGDVQELYASTGQIGGLDIRAEDSAEVVWTHKNGVRGSLHLDYFRRPKRHDLEITCAEGVISWDYESSSAVLRKTDGKVTVFPAPEGYTRNHMFLDEMKHFIRILEKDIQPVCTYDDGKAALHLAWGILQSGCYHKRVIFA